MACLWACLGGQTEIVAPEDAKGQQRGQISDSGEQAVRRKLWRKEDLCPVMPGFSGFFWFFLSRRDARVVGQCGVLGAARRCGWILGVGLVATGGLRGATVSRPLRRRMVWRMGWVGGCGCRLAEVAGWLRLLASFFAVLLFQIQKNFKKVRDASRSDYVIPASRPSRKLQAVPGEGFSGAVAARSRSRAVMVHDCASSPSRWMSTFESRPKTRLCGHCLLCDSRRR